MKTLRLILCLAFALPAFAFAGLAITLSFVGQCVGGTVGLFFGQGFGEAFPPQVVEVLFGLNAKRRD
jgi:hypothetical protein